MTSPTARLTELDWLRIGAFGLLILYHCGMFYVPWDWHVKSPRLLPWLEWPMSALNPWRMPLVFLVSGAATGLLLCAPRTSGALLRERSLRLMLPLVFGMLVVVPPQAYLEVVEKAAYAGSYLDFVRLYLTGYHGFCRGRDCLALPTWNHLWFLPYLWLYTLLLVALGVRRGRLAPAWAMLGRGPWLLALPWLWLALARALLMPHFPTTHDVWRDVYSHALYLPVFTLGLVLFGHADDRHGAWAAAVRLRWWALGLALGAQGVAWWAEWHFGGDALPAASVLAGLRASTAVRQWAPLVALLGFARLHLAQRDGPWRRALNEAVFPCYIAHQTLTVVAGHMLAKQAWPLALEATALVAITVGGGLMLWRAVRGVPVLAPCMGVQRRRGLR